jgi:predicted ABC-type ATPase
MAKRQARPELLVLAGVNGAGKSSHGGALLEERGLTWFNPDTLARQLLRQGSITKSDADADAWEAGRRSLEVAIAEGRSYAFETTLGGQTIAHLIRAAAKTHDITILFYGLDSVEHHLARVRQRVLAGGHDIPEERIRVRWEAARSNLIALLPYLTNLQVFDNSQDVALGEPLPNQKLVLWIEKRECIQPRRGDIKALAAVPRWAKAIVEAALILNSRI